MLREFVAAQTAPTQTDVLPYDAYHIMIVLIVHTIDITDYCTVLLYWYYPNCTYRLL